MSTSITDRVRQVAEDLENEDSEPLIVRHTRDVTFRVSHSGAVQEVVVDMETDGPQIEVECLSGVVVGHYGGESHRQEINAPNVTEHGRRLAEQMEKRID